MNYLISLLTILLTVSCGKSEDSDTAKTPTTRKEMLEQSKESWQALNADTYSYKVRHMYYVDSVARQAETTIYVKNGVVACRKFIQKGTDLQLREYYEIDAGVSSHDFGFPALTMEALYDQCSQLIETEKPKPELHFALDENNVLSSCFLEIEGERLTQLKEATSSAIMLNSLTLNENLCE